MKRPWMFSSQGLVTLHLGSRVHMSYNWDVFYWSYSEAVLDPVVDRKVYRPSRKIAQDGRTQPAVHASQAIMLEDVLDCVWIRDRAGWTDVR